MEILRGEYKDKKKKTKLYIMVRSIFSTSKKSYCFNCNKRTITINNKKEYWKKEEKYIIKGNCEECNGSKILHCARRHGEYNKLLT